MSEPLPIQEGPGGSPMLLTLSEASERVRLSPWALRRAIKRGELDASKPAGRIRISEQAIADWLKLTRVEPEVEPTREAPPLPASSTLSAAQADSFRARLRRNAR
jgi:excisionase family DNA binding protein